MIPQSLRALLTGLIDYAGLFPPASLPLEKAVANYESHRKGEHSWMLGRLVVPLHQVSELPIDFPLSVLVTIDDLRKLDASIDTIEVKAVNVNEIDTIAGAATGRTVYVEVPDADLVRAVRRAGMRAKVRTGGITHDAIPAAERVARFIRECAAERVAFKATAGLHHPLRCIRPLTYEPNAPVGTMHGFVNVFMTAALVGTVDEEVLLETDPRAFRFEDERALWKNYSAPTALIERVRREFAISFGSCSFEEPVADLKELGWL